MERADANRDHRAIRAVFKSWYRAMEDGSVAGLISLVTPDVLMKPPGAPPIAGRRALKEALSGFFDSHSETVDFEVQEIEVCGRLAYGRVTETATIRSRSGEDASVVNGMHLTILRRQAEGEWLIARDISSRFGANG